MCHGRLAALEKAEGEKVQVLKAAEADAEAKYLQGQGIARQRQAIVNGLRESVLNFERDVSDISSRDVIEMMMITQYFDMLKDIGLSSKCVLGPSDVFVHALCVVLDLRTCPQQAGLCCCHASNPVEVWKPKHANAGVHVE